MSIKFLHKTRISLLFLLCSLLLSCGTDSTDGGGGPVIVPPENFSIVADSDSSVTLAWVLNSSGEEQVILDRKIAGTSGGFGVAAGLAPGTEQYTDSLLNPNLSYLYRWRVLGNGEEAVSDTLRIRNDRAISAQNRIGTIQHDDEINSVAFGPATGSGDVLLIAYGSTDATTEIREITGNGISGVRQRFLVHTSRVNSVAFHPGGELLATAGFDGNVRLINLDNGDTIRTLPHPSLVRSVAFDGEGAQAVTAGSDGVVRLWDLETEAGPLPFSNGNNYEAAALSTDGSRIAGAGHNKLTVDLWDIDTEALTPWKATPAGCLV